MANFWSHSKFVNSFAKTFPSWSNEVVTSSLQTPKVFYANAKMDPVSAPQIIAWSDDVAKSLDLPDEKALVADPVLKQRLAEIFTGNTTFPGMQPIATRYGGHQFGTWAGQLGDGRAILLGELQNARGQSLEIQLKGAGRTAYSRHADGRAVLRSSLREFICSEAMHYLGIPTTRALSCVLTGDEVIRDMFYDGNPEAEPGAITTRVAESFIRFGHFEILAASGETENLRSLIRYSIEKFYPDLKMGDDASSEENIGRWFQEVIKRTANLVVEWLRVGFVHGVLNTDNMSILGLTIDYGPYGWLDSYDPTWTPNTTDFERRRYRYEQQPGIGLWNLTRLAEALGTIVSDQAILEKSLKSYIEIFQSSYKSMRLSKLGLVTSHADDIAFLEELDAALVSTEVDMTIFYRNLNQFIECDVRKLDDAEWIVDRLRDALYAERPTADECSELISWIRSYRQRIDSEGRDPAVIIHSMNKINPVFVPRNYQVQEVLDEIAQGKLTLLKQMIVALKSPYEWNSFTESWFRKRPEWARRRPGCSALSCSS